MAILERLLPHQRPKLVRADCAFGNETLMKELEEIDQPYLFKLKQSVNVKKLVQKHWGRDAWCNVGQGWQAREDQLQLMGWSQSRRVIVLRRQIKGELLVETKSRGRGKKSQLHTGNKVTQHCLAFIDHNETVKLYEYAVLVTNSHYNTAAMGQLYRDRADCENGFDELKNQWGWGGFCTQDIERCNLTAQTVALVYNWWSWYCRLAHPKARLEAISSRPLLLAAVGKLTQHAGQKKLLLTMTHAATSHVKGLVANVQAGLKNKATYFVGGPEIYRFEN
ncbi:MAG: transposase family protein [Solimicrobium sp.]|nr:transposase family protein [Solimicrobium sp.]